MEELKGNLKLFKFLLTIWFTAILFSAVMYTFGLIYDINIAVILSGVTGVSALIGIIYTAYSIIRIENTLKYYKQKNEISNEI